MNKKLIYLISFFCLFCFANLAFAQITNPLASGGVNDIPSLLAKLWNAIAALIAVLGGIMFIVAGVMYAMSAGDPGMIGKAKNALTYAIIGIVVGLSAGAVGGIAATVKGLKTGANDVNGVINNIATLVGPIIASVGVIMLIFAGALYVMSGGEPAKRAKAKTALIYAVAGIAVGVAASAIVATIRQIIGA